ncbi:MAG: hypothetical protein IJU45_04445 [Clostridia bacterium]|nr:hypothetical protein [Clostridia bacterium]
MFDYLSGLFNLPVNTVKQVVIIAAALIGALWLLNFIRRRVRSARNSLRDELLGGLTAADIKFAIDQAKNAELDPPERSISGATGIYLNKIIADFPDFHLPEAKAAIKLLINEYLPIRFEGADSFAKSKVEKSLAQSVRKEENLKNVSDITVHKISISDYIKTNEYATIVYQASAGYRLDDKKTEDRFIIESTIKFIEDELPAHLLVCKNCGGTIESTAQKVCPYCGSGIVWDTRMSWRFTKIESVE